MVAAQDGRHGWVAAIGRGLGGVGGGEGVHLSTNDFLFPLIVRRKGWGWGRMGRFLEDMVSLPSGQGALR